MIFSPLVQTFDFEHIVLNTEFSFLLILRRIFIWIHKNQFYNVRLAYITKFEIRSELQKET